MLGVIPSYNVKTGQNATEQVRHTLPWWIIVLITEGCFLFVFLLIATIQVYQQRKDIQILGYKLTGIGLEANINVMTSMLFSMFRRM